VACEPLTVIIFDKAKLFQTGPTSQRNRNFGTKLHTLVCYEQEEFSTLFKLYSAQERLEYLEAKHPAKFYKRVSLSQIAFLSWCSKGNIKSN